MPICPSCYATIHSGAERQCPVCGYSLRRAQAVFGNRPVEFTRVVDEAGVLTHSERKELMQLLQDWERRIPPVALGIYITSHGQLRDFRAHAHWVLNQAVIHHPSFGKRELSRAIEDAEFAMGGPRRSRPDKPSRLARFVQWWERTGRMVLDAVHPYPPPVQQEWMLVLVLDVQLEVACFSWGYMLDPYINPDSINSAIISARLYFRERAMAVGLRKVMRAVMRQLAARSHGVNRRMRRSGVGFGPMVMLVGLAGLSMASGLVAAPVLPDLPDDDAAEEVEEDTAEEVDEESPTVPTPPTVSQVVSPAKPASTPPSAHSSTSGNAASLTTAPRWTDADRGHLLAGEMPGVYQMLGAGADAPPGKTQSKGTRADSRIPKNFFPEYKQPGVHSLIDPQGLLREPERADIEYALRLINGRSRYHFFVAVLNRGQEVPIELAPATLARLVAPPGEYSVMLMYSMDDTPRIELGCHEIDVADADRHAWLKKAQHAAMLRGGGADGLLAAVQVLHSCLAPLAQKLPPLEQRSEVQIPLIPIEMQEEDVAEEVSFMDEVRLAWDTPWLRKGAAVVGGLVGLLVLLFGFFWIRRRSGRLLPSEPDVRLSSPYGAGVSRNVNYLEGREEKRKNDFL